MAAHRTCRTHNRELPNLRTADDIAALYHDRKTRMAGRHARMQRVSDVYNGRTELPLPELRVDEKAAVPNLVQQGTDQMARRAASVLPNILCPPLRPGIKASEEKADQRKMIHYGWWEKSSIKKVQRQRAGWFITYSSAPAIIRPDPNISMPRWDLHSPFDVYPARMHLGSYTPSDVIVRHSRDLRWITDRYPQAAMHVHKGKSTKPDDTFDVLEYVDADEIVFTVLGKDTRNEWDTRPPLETMAVELTRRPNRAGVCWAVIPERPSLDAPVGHFDGIIGMYETQAALMALEVIAVRRSIWPEVWFENPNGPQTPHVVQHYDAETDTPGIVANGRINTLQMDPSFRSVNTMDRLEFAQRQTAGLPQELGGSSQSNVRTGRRGSQILSASIDFTIAEAQDAFAEALHEENMRAIAIDKGYFNKSKTIYVSTKGMRGKVDYRPSDTFEERAEHIVTYPIAGTDLADLVINGGQRVGMGTMSKRSFMEIDPLVDDVDIEENRVRLEGAEAAFFAAFQEEIANPEAEWQAEQVADFARRLAKGEKWYEAVAAINKDLQERQAQGAEPGTPEAMPGLAPPGAPGGIPTVGEPSPSMGNLTSLLGQLGTADLALASRGPERVSA
jgi:hypothetical protein